MQAFILSAAVDIQPKEFITTICTHSNSNTKKRGVKVYNKLLFKLNSAFT